MKHLLLLCTFALWSAFASAQTHTVSGTIRDAAGNPLPGVVVIVPGTTNGTITDLDGHYSLKIDGAQKLQASFIGFKTSEIDLSSGSGDAVLFEDNKEMDEVVVVAYGTSTKGSYTLPLRSALSSSRSVRYLMRHRLSPVPWQVSRPRATTASLAQALPSVSVAQVLSTQAWSLSSSLTVCLLMATSPASTRAISSL